MKTYIVITPDGASYDANDEENFMCHYLGMYEAESPEHAAELCRQQLKEWSVWYENITTYELASTERHCFSGVYEYDENDED